MIKACHILLLLLLSCSTIKANEIGVLRKMLSASIDNKEMTEQFYKKTRSIKESDSPLLIGFKAMSDFMICKTVVSPISKLSYFNSGKEMLEKAIKKEPNNTELIYFRFTVQSNVPSLLNYNSNISSDKLFLITYLIKNKNNTSKDAELYAKIKTYLLQPKICTEQEKKILNLL